MGTVELEIDAEDTFSDEVIVRREFNFSLVSDSFVGTVTLQRRFNADDDWRDVATYTDSFEGYDVQPGGARYRFGVKPGAYTSGSIIGRLSSADL